MFEDTDSYRDYSTCSAGRHPTLTWLATPLTKVKLSYEYFHDGRTAALPHVQRSYVWGAPNQFFGNPTLSTPATQNVAMAVVEHEFNNGLTVKNQTRFADYKRFYQNVYPARGRPQAPHAGGYNNRNDRQNASTRPLV